MFGTFDFLFLLSVRLAERVGHGARSLLATRYSPFALNGSVSGF